MKSLQTFIRENGITATTQRVMSRENGGDWQPDARHWIVTLVRGARTMPVEFTQGSAHTKPPTVEDVLGCLADDIASVEIESDREPRYNSFEDWAGDLGYDTDSRKAERIYTTIKQQAADLRKFLNFGVKSNLPLNDRLAELLWKVDRER